MIEYTVRVDDYGNKYWHLNGKTHREDGPAVEYANGDKCWFLKEKRHRADGPAIEFANGDKHWFLNGERHREDGPAVEYVSGGGKWYLNGEELTQEEHKRRLNTPQELTIAELEKKLGHRVKIVGGD
jgi:hypothetical protein